MGKIEGKPKSLTGHVLKAMGLLGSVQGLGVVCSVVRAKLVAIWIGAAGVGVFGLLKLGQYNKHVFILSKSFCIDFINPKSEFIFSLMLFNSDSSFELLLLLLKLKKE